MRSSSPLRFLVIALFAVLAGGGISRGQTVPTVGPATSPPPLAPGAPAAQSAPPPRPGAPAAEAESAPTGITYLPGTTAEVEPVYGPPPGVHVVRQGDTLWDLCGTYFGNPWEWPRVWSLNPGITNPHWIYPGDLVRLRAEAEPAVVPESQPAVVPEPTAPAAEPELVTLRQIAFLDDAKQDRVGTVLGSKSERHMLAEGDEIYIEYPDGKPPQVGARYAIYSSSEAIRDPAKKKTVGAYVYLHGEVEILDVKKGKTARGLITYSNDVIERGQKVGPVKTQFKQVAPVASDRDLEGLIIGQIGFTRVIGTGQLVFIDRGKTEGVQVGNRFQIVRRGDRLIPRAGTDVGLDDRRYPDQVVALASVLEVGEDFSLCVVSYQSEEILAGDHAVLRKGR